MAIYALIFLIGALLALASDRRGSRSLAAFRLIFLFLVVFATFRFNVGCDWGGYFVNYLDAGRMNFAEALFHLEPAWWGWLWFVHLLDLPYPAANLLPSAFFFSGIWYLARRQPNPAAILVFAFPVLVLGIAMSGIRQGAAIGIVCFAITAFQAGRPVRFSIFLILASLWHSSALIFFLLLPFTLSRDRRVHLLAVLLLGIPILAALLQSEGADTALDRYTGETTSVAYGAPLRLGLLAVTALFYFVFLRARWLKKYPNEALFISLMAIGMLGTVALIPFSSVIADRLGYYLIVPQLIILGRISVLLSGRQLLLGQTIAYGMFAAYLAIWIGFSSLFEACYIPYETWIFGFPGPIVDLS